MLFTLLIVQPFDSLWSLAILFASFGFDWINQLIRLYAGTRYVRRTRRTGAAPLPSVSIIVPVVNEKPEIFRTVLSAVRRAARNLDAEFFVVANGGSTRNAIEIATSLGFTTITLEIANKRTAIAAAAAAATKDVAILLDSDTVVADDTLELLVENFDDSSVGGVAPRNTILNKRESVMSFFCHWSDLGRMHAFRGLSAHHSLHCLPGRLIAIRRDRLQRYAPALLQQTVLGRPILTGDDRALTSYLLRDGYRTIYDERATVASFAPAGLQEFARQRLRWARATFLATLLAGSWMFTRPYMALVLVSDILTRWISFAASLLVLYALATGRFAAASAGWSTPELVLTIGAGLLLGSFARQIPQLLRSPRHIWFAPIFSLMWMFVLRPIEWYANVTCLKQDWLTRDASAIEHPPRLAAGEHAPAG